jgi:HPr kinase/phosphorylase
MTQIGFFNPVHPWTVQVLGDAGSDYLSRLEPSVLAELPARLRRRGMATLIVARGGTLADEAPWRRAGIGLERRDEPAHDIVHALRTAVAERAAARQVVHGVLLDVHGVGVLLTGDAASGKSTLALELVTRGHRLVADDAVELARPAPGIVVGRCPEMLRGYVATRDLGVVDVARMHGARSVLPQRRVDLVVRLAPPPRRAGARQLLAGRRGTRRLLGEPLPAVTLPVHSRGARTGHNLAALVEAACLDWRLREDGIEADAALARRQARVIAKKK